MGRPPIGAQKGKGRSRARRTALDAVAVYKAGELDKARFGCRDCGINVIEAGDFCMLKSAIWEGQLGLRGSDNLCIACIERRLGRTLCLDDFDLFPIVEGHPMSLLCRHRYGLEDASAYQRFIAGRKDGDEEDRKAGWYTRKGRRKL